MRSACRRRRVRTDLEVGGRPHDDAGHWPQRPVQAHRELDRRINDELPDLRKRSAVSTTTPVKKKGSAAAPVGRGGSTTTATATVKRKFVLNQAEQQQMLAIRLDPKNPEHVKHFARARMGLN